MKRNKEAKHEQRHDDDNISINDSITLDDNNSIASIENDNESVGSHHSSVETGSKRSKQRKSSNASRTSHTSQHSKDSGSAFSFTKKKQAKLLVNTTLIFLDLNGNRSEYKLNSRPDSYSSLQREVSRLRPLNRAMFVFQYQDGEKVFPVNFKSSDQFVVRELLAKQPPFEGLYSLPVRWETEQYHDAKHRQDIEGHSYMGAVSTHHRTTGGYK